MSLVEKGAEASVRKWLESFVVELNLCPFAKPVLKSQSLNLITLNGDVQQCLTSLARACEQLDTDPAIETSLLILESGFTNFYDYLDLITLAEALLHELDYEGIYQIASFHPKYRFAGSSAESVDNYTNRSPYPIIHVLRESSITRALARYACSANIPERNRRTMIELGDDALAKRLADCYR